MSSINPGGTLTSVGVYFKDSSNLDAFGRLRVSTPQTIFDSKQIGAHNDLFWDIALSTSGASSSTSKLNASTTLSVSASDGYAIRQTFMRFNYQPAKSTSIALTASNFHGQNQVTKRLGYFAGTLGGVFAPTNGLFFSSDGYVGSEVIAVNMAKAGNITSVPQSQWNLDKMDGTGVSGFDVDFSKTQIYWIDFEWLGVGRVRFGLVLNGLIYYCHEFLNANNLGSVYMSSPNLPVRYEIRSAGGTGSLDSICSSVVSEGGTNHNGVLRGISSGTGHLDANIADSIYAGVIIRLNADHLDLNVILNEFTILATTNDSFRWILALNPVVAGNINYTNLTESGIDYFFGSTANTISSLGTVMHEGWASSSLRITNQTLESALRLGVSISGVRDTIVLATMPLSANADHRFALNWREIQ